MEHAREELTLISCASWSFSNSGAWPLCDWVNISKAAGNVLKLVSVLIACVCF